jgi:hypothetical protein
MQVVSWDRRSGAVTAASDPRGIGRSAVVEGESRRVPATAAERH